MLLDGILLDRQSSVPLRRQLTGYIELRILAGQIRPGHRLPSVRRLSELLGLHRNTVAAAYRDLVRSGFASARRGSGVYVRFVDGGRGLAAASVSVHGARDFVLRCEDPHLAAVLEAELESRFVARVRHEDEPCGPACDLILAPSTGFLRRVRIMPRPAIVAVVSSSDAVHRLVSAAVTVHAGEGIGYLPVSASSSVSLVRVTRLARMVTADFDAIGTARRILGPSVESLPVISERSLANILRLALHHERRRQQPEHRKTAERSRTAGV